MTLKTKTLVFFLFSFSYLSRAQISEKISFSLEYGAQTIGFDEMNALLLDTNETPLGNVNKPRENGFDRFQSYGIGISVRPNKFWDIGIAGRWHVQQIEHYGALIFASNNPSNIAITGLSRMELLQIGISSRLYLNTLFEKQSNFEFGGQLELAYSQANFEYYNLLEYPFNETIIYIEQILYRAQYRTLSGRFGIFASYGIPFRKTKISIGLNFGIQVGNDQSLRNGGGESFMNLGKTVTIPSSGSYGSLFLKLSR